MFAFPLGDQAIGLLYAVPVVVPVHRPVATDDRGDTTDTEQAEALFEVLNLRGTLGRGCVATVGKNMYENLGHAFVEGCFQYRVDIVLVGVHGAGAEEPHDMKAPAGDFGLCHGGQKGGIAIKTSILDGQSDTGKALIDDTAGADGHVSHFAVADDIPWESHGDAGSLQCGQRIKSVDFFDGGQFCFTDRVALGDIAHSPSIENDENNRSVHIFCLIFQFGKTRFSQYSIYRPALTKGFGSAMMKPQLSIGIPSPCGSETEAYERNRIFSLFGKTK